MELCPLLFYSLCFFLGIASRLAFHPLYLPLLLLLFFLWKNRTLSGSLTLCIGFLFALQTTSLPSLPEEGVVGKGVFTLDSVAYGASPFGTSLVTKGTLETFTTDTDTYKRVPCLIYTSPKKGRAINARKLIIEGRLLPKKTPYYVLKPTHVHPQHATFSLAEWRFQIKDGMRKHLSSLFPQRETAAFLLSMITGEIDERLMSMQFNRLGLLHLVGVGGFQFSLLAAVLGALLKTVFKGTKGIYILITLLSLYALILGGSPPIQRAYIVSILYAIAQLVHLQISPLNALGAALFWVLLLDPCAIFQLGFQFTFLCTAAIFTIYPFFRKYANFSRSFTQIQALPRIDRIGHTLFFFFREALALNLSIHLATLPLLFYHFHKFPLLSLAYNLFLPAAVSLAYLFLIPGLLLYPFSHLLAAPFLKIAGLLSHELIFISSNPPMLFDLQCRLPHFTLSWVILSVTLIFVFFLRVKERESEGLFKKIR